MYIGAKHYVQLAWTLAIVFNAVLLSVTFAQIDVKHNVTNIYGVIDTRNVSHGTHQWTFDGKPGEKYLLVLNIKNSKSLQQGDFKLFGSEVAAIGCYALSNHETTESDCMKLWNTRYMKCELYTISGDAQVSFKKRNQLQEMKILYNAVNCDFSEDTTVAETFAQSTILQLTTNRTILDFTAATTMDKSTTPQSLNNLKLIVPTVVVAILLISLVIILVVCLRCRNRRKPRHEENSKEDNIYEEIDVIPPNYDERMNQTSRTPTVVKENEERAVAPPHVYSTMTRKSNEKEQSPVVNIVLPPSPSKSDMD